jgi:acyl-CoA dehydrogenase
MNFDFSEEQKLLQAEAHRFLLEQCPVSVTRRVIEQAQMFDSTLWLRLIEQGWPGLAIPCEYGGAGLGYFELCVTAEELGRALAPVPLSTSIYLCAESLVIAGSEPQKRLYLRALAGGTMIGTLAFAEGYGFPGEHSVDVEYRNGCLFGTKWPVADGDAADLAVVLARAIDGAVGLYLCDLRQPGVTRESLKTIDPSRAQARLQFQGGACEPLGTRAGWADFQHTIDRAAVLTAFEQVGGAGACLDMAVAYAQEHKAFGRPIGSFQAIKHKLADMYVKNELARANAHYGAWALSVDAPELPLAAAAARVSATDAYEFAAREGLHIHGGMGFTWEMDCHLHYRRSRSLAVNLGGASLWKRRIADQLEAQL